MKLTIFGSGYVGLVTGACFAEMGNKVLCVDIDQEKVQGLKNGIVPIFEPGLSELIQKNYQLGNLDFSSDPDAAVRFGQCIFIAVGTPQDEDGSADLQYVLSVARTIGQNMNAYTVVVDKSTVPVGTAKKVAAEIQQALSARKLDLEFDVVSNPEFLKEGAAVADFMKPDRIIIGSESERATEVLKELYGPFNRNHDRFLVMEQNSAELTKYAANAMLATKISFMNDMANIAEKVGADIEDVRIGIGSDPRIGFQFIYPGAGYGGSCFPKDVKALLKSAEDHGYQSDILAAVDIINYRQKQLLFKKISAHYKDELAGKVIALWGLAFKPNTDDMREAPSCSLMEALWAAGASVRAYDPKAGEEASRLYGDRKGKEFVLLDSANEALKGADALAILTEWNEFRSPDFSYLKEQLANDVIFDGRNLFDPKTVARYGLSYYGIGRGKNHYQN